MDGIGKSLVWIELSLVLFALVVLLPSPAVVVIVCGKASIFYVGERVLFGSRQLLE